MNAYSRQLLFIFDLCCLAAQEWKGGEDMAEEEGFSERLPGRRFGGGPRGFRQSRGPVPVKEGDELDVTIEAVGRRGDGIAKVENFVVFVPGTKAGDRVKVKITSVGGSFATASVVT